MVCKYKFGKTVYFITFLIIVCALLLAVLSVINYIDGGNLVNLIVSLILNCTVLAFAIKLFYSKYEITDKGVDITISFIKLKIDIKDIFNVKFFKTENVLVLYYFKENVVKQHFLQISEEYYTEFIKNLRLQKPQILYEEVV